VGKVATTVVALLVLTSCGDSSDSAAPGEVPPPVTSTPPGDDSSLVLDAAAEREQVEQEVLTAYIAAREAELTASEVADPSLPLLEMTHTGAALQATRDSLEAFRTTGRVGRDAPNSVFERRAAVVSVDGDSSSVRDCTVDDRQIVVAASGEVVNDLVATVLFQGTMVIEGGSWKLASLSVEDEWEGIAGCAEQ
jgi:hypothetical protein